MNTWLPPGADEWEGRPIAREAAGATPRQREVLAGNIGEVRVISRRHGLQFEAVLDDGTGNILLGWAGLGWTGPCPGIESGTSLVVEGTVGCDRGWLVLLNPLYELKG